MTTKTPQAVPPAQGDQIKKITEIILMETTAEIDREVFFHCLTIAKQNAPRKGLPSRWCLGLGYFREYKGRDPQFDVGHAWKHTLAMEVA